MNPVFLSRRRALIEHSQKAFGLDYITVEPDETEVKLVLHFFGHNQAINVQAANIRITARAGPPLHGFSLGPVDPSTGQWTIRIPSHSLLYRRYELELVNCPGLDPFFTSAPFVVAETAVFDPVPPARPVPVPVPEANINYLARDYQSFTREMLGRLTQTLPAWQERSPAGIGTVIVEALAQAADELAYYQDAVGTEAYLHTARRRLSLTRHCRLLGFRPPAGANNRVLARMLVDQHVGSLKLEAGTPLLTATGPATRVQPGTIAWEESLSRQPVIYETMAAATLYGVHAAMNLYDWGAEEFVLRKGTTEAALSGKIQNLEPGAILVIQQVRGGGAPNARQANRHAVRLTAVTHGLDLLGGKYQTPATDDPVPITRIAWEQADALPCEFVVSSRIDGILFKRMVVVAGNIVVADSGQTVTETVTYGREQPEPLLKYAGLVFNEPFLKAGSPLSEALQQSGVDTVPALRIKSLSDGLDWTVRPDLLSCTGFDRACVVEIDNEGRTQLRFGDGINGRRPGDGAEFQVTYRVSPASASLGRDALFQVGTAEARILGVTNPLPSVDGPDPMSNEEIRLFAPESFQSQRRLVTAEDYERIAQSHPGVRAAVGVLRWTGSWDTAFVSIQRRDARAVTQTFCDELTAYLSRYQLMGRELAVRPPAYVPLRIVLVVRIEPGFFQATVQESLRAAFCAHRLPGGRTGFFYPGNFTFGQDVYWSQLLETAQHTEGVAWIDLTNGATEFRRVGSFANQMDAGKISIGPLEVARLDNDPEQPQNGTIEFVMRGGRE